MDNKSLNKFNIIKDILNIANNASVNALRAVNTQLVIRNWLIGKRIHEEVLTNRSSDYGKRLISNLAKQLSRYGKGFDQSSLHKYLKFYRLYKGWKILETVFPQSMQIGNEYENFLPFTHYLLLITINNKNERDWYEKQARLNLWSYRVLKRNVQTDMYHRILSNQNLNRTNQIVGINKNNYLKSTYILEFLGLNEKYYEKELEQSLINNLSKFMIELGRGYTFFGRQIHLRTHKNDYYIDLVFYNTELKCYLLIDLKTNKIEHKDIGQMLLYLDLFDKLYKHKSDNKSIGMVLSSDLNSDIVKYLMINNKNNVVASKYLTYLPTKDEIRKELEKIYSD